MASPEGNGGEEGLRKGTWTREEDEILADYVRNWGEKNWNNVPRITGLNRSGKSCRLRWTNHLNPSLKKSTLSPEEIKIIIALHQSWGNKWSKITAQLPGRTDNEIKNYWNIRKRKRERAGLPLYPSEMVDENQNGEGIDVHGNHSSYNDDNGEGQTCHDATTVVSQSSSEQSEMETLCNNNNLETPSVNDNVAPMQWYTEYEGFQARNNANSSGNNNNNNSAFISESSFDTPKHLSSITPPPPPLPPLDTPMHLSSIIPPRPPPPPPLDTPMYLSSIIPPPPPPLLDTPMHLSRIIPPSPPPPPPLEADDSTIMIQQHKYHPRVYENHYDGHFEASSSYGVPSMHLSSIPPPPLSPPPPPPPPPLEAHDSTIMIQQQHKYHPTVYENHYDGHFQASSSCGVRQLPDPLMHLLNINHGSSQFQPTHKSGSFNVPSPPLPPLPPQLPHSSTDSHFFNTDSHFFNSSGTILDHDRYLDGFHDVPTLEDKNYDETIPSIDYNNCNNNHACSSSSGMIDELPSLQITETPLPPLPPSLPYDHHQQLPPPPPTYHHGKKDELPSLQITEIPSPPPLPPLQYDHHQQPPPPQTYHHQPQATIDSYLGPPSPTYHHQPQATIDSYLERGGHNDDDLLQYYMDNNLIIY